MKDGSETCWYGLGNQFVKVTDMGMRGTFNFAPYHNTLGSALGHFFADIVPFYLFDSLPYAARPYAPL